MRNIWCPRYDECLTQAAKKESPNFDCAGCPWAGDTAGKSFDSAEIKEEGISCGGLLAVIFGISEYHRVTANS